MRELTQKLASLAASKIAVQCSADETGSSPLKGGRQRGVSLRESDVKEDPPIRPPHLDGNELTIVAEDPRAEDSLALLDEMMAFSVRTYPEDAEGGVTLATPVDLTRGVFVVARLGGWPAGMCAVLDHPPVDDELVMELKRMYVRAEARGRRIAENMLRWLEIQARIRGARKIVLLCGPRQPEALRLYERCGYSRRSAFGKYEEHPLSIFFEKRL